MPIIHILPENFLVAVVAMKPFLEMNSHNAAVDRGFWHHFTSAPIPQTCGRAVRMALRMSPPDVSTDTGSGANDSHPAAVAGLGPLTLMDADRIISLACARIEIVFVDPKPFGVNCTNTLATSAT